MYGELVKRITAFIGSVLFTLVLFAPAALAHQPKETKAQKAADKSYKQYQKQYAKQQKKALKAQKKQMKQWNKNHTTVSTTG